MDEMRQKARSREDEYFAREDKERIEQLREERRKAQAAAGILGLDCPRCDGRLMEETYEGVLIDRCDGCGGVWLDPGELQALTAKTSGSGLLGWLSGKK